MLGNGPTWRGRDKRFNDGCELRRENCECWGLILSLPRNWYSVLNGWLVIAVGWIAMPYLEIYRSYRTDCFMVVDVLVSFTTCLT